MRPPPPAITLFQKHRGTGTICCRGREAPIHAFELSREAYSPSSDWRVAAHYAPEVSRTIHQFLGRGRPQTSLKGTDEFGREILIPTLSIQTAYESYLEAHAHEIVVDHVALPSLPESQYVTIYLSPTPLAYAQKDFLVHHWTGEIKPLDDDDRDEALPHIPSSLGHLAFSLRYQYENVAIGTGDALLRIPLPALHAKVPQEALTLTPLGSVRALTEELVPFFRLLSFLGRNHVRWTEARLQSANFGPANDMRHNSLAVIRSVGLLYDNDRNQLVVTRRVPPSGYADMLARLHALPYKATALTAMLYLVEAVRAPYSDVRLLSAFTAFEALLTALTTASGSDRILTPGRFDKVSRSIKAALAGSSLELSSDELAAVKSKLPELNRPALLQKAAGIIRAHGVDTSDLWAPGTAIEDGLAGPIRRRNAYIHAGQVPPGLQMSVDCHRIHAVTERLLFKLLGGNDDWLDPMAYLTYDDLRHMDDVIAAEAGSAT